jgi:hypothetical protein
MRPPWWRWGRALELHEGQLRYRRFDDEWVRRARRFVGVLARRDGDLGNPAVVSADRALAETARLSTTSQATLRHEVEARILAGQSDSEIAGIVGLDADVIEAFQALWFDIRARLNAIGWIGANIYGARFYRGTGGGDPELAARLIGFVLGPTAIDVYFNRIPRVERLAESIRLFVLAATAPRDDASAYRWTVLAERVAEAERKRAASRVDAVSGPLIVPADAVAFALAAKSSGLARPDRRVARGGKTDDRRSPVVATIPPYALALTSPALLRMAL